MTTSSGADTPVSVAQTDLRSLIIHRLLQRKTWNYLRYLHAEKAIHSLLVRHPNSVSNVLVIGCGTGLAETLLAVKYPEIHFTLTDYHGATHNTKEARSLQSKFSLNNISWSDLDLLDSTSYQLKFDLVYSIEVLEHIEDDRLAVQNMHKLSKRYIFCLVPFSEESRNSDSSLREKVWVNHEHYLCGYNIERLVKLFPGIINISGCYWKKYGCRFRKKLTDFSAQQISDNVPTLLDEAQLDLVDEIPTTVNDALGIWIMALSSEVKNDNSESAIVSGKNEAKQYLITRLLQRKTWNYLRYIHAKHAIQSLLSRYPNSISSVLVIGCGTGLAETLLSVEYPGIKFTLTDYEGATHNIKEAKAIQARFGIDNIDWAELNLLGNNSFDKKYDLVYSIEVLEHLKDDALAAQAMHNLSQRFIFCLVPFSEESRNQNHSLRSDVWEKHEHYLCGYNLNRLVALFPNIINVRGCYWRQFGVQFRKKITGLTSEFIESNVSSLLEEADLDLVDQIPINTVDALGIWIVALN